MTMLPTIREELSATEIIALITAELGTVHMASVKGEVTPDSDLEADLAMNSMDRIIVACALEQELGVEIGDAELERWQTLADVFACVERTGKEQACG